MSGNYATAAALRQAIVDRIRADARALFARLAAEVGLGAVSAQQVHGIVAAHWRDALRDVEEPWRPARLTAPGSRQASSPLRRSVESTMR